MSFIWVSAPRMTVGVEVDDRDVIVKSAPIVRRFVGQPLSNLLAWLAGLGGDVYLERL